MSEVRQALTAWEQHLEEVIGVTHSAHVVDRFDHVVTPEVLEVTVQRIRTERQTDLAVLGGELRLDMAELRSELCGEMAQLRTEMVQLRAEVGGEMAQLRTDLRGELQAEGSGLRQEMAERFERMATQWRRDLLLVTGAQFTALAGAVLVLA